MRAICFSFGPFSAFFGADLGAEAVATLAALGAAFAVFVAALGALAATALGDFGAFDFFDAAAVLDLATVAAFDFVGLATAFGFTAFVAFGAAAFGAAAFGVASVAFFAVFFFAIASGPCTRCVTVRSSEPAFHLRNAFLTEI